MTTLTSLHKYKQHLEERYLKLIESSNDYKFIDEHESDNYAFKAMKILQKINKVNYLEREVLN